MIESPGFARRKRHALEHVRISDERLEVWRLRDHVLLAADSELRHALQRGRHARTIHRNGIAEAERVLDLNQHRPSGRIVGRVDVDLRGTDVVDERGSSIDRHFDVVHRSGSIRAVEIAARPDTRRGGKVLAVNLEIGVRCEAGLAEEGRNHSVGSGVDGGQRWRTDLADLPVIRVDEENISVCIHRLPARKIELGLDGRPAVAGVAAHACAGEGGDDSALVDLANASRRKLPRCTCCLRNQPKRPAPTGAAAAGPGPPSPVKPAVPVSGDGCDDAVLLLFGRACSRARWRFHRR